LKRRQVILLGFIIVLALGLRLIGIDSREIQYDDAFSIFLSQQTLDNIIKGTAADTMPPLFYFVLHFWQTLGSEIFFLRLLGVIFSIAILVISFDLVKRIYGSPAGLWTAFFIAIAPIHIYHSQDIRMYTLLVLGQITYFWFFLRIFVKPDPHENKYFFWVGLVISGTIAMYSHNLAIFGLVVANLYLVIKRSWQALGHLIGGQFFIGLAALPWLIMVPEQFEKIQRAFWTPLPGILEIFQAVIQFTANLPVKGVLLPIVAILSGQILILVVLATWRNRRQSHGSDWIVAIAVLLPLLLFVVSYLVRPVFVARGFLVASLAYYGLIGSVVAKGSKHGVGIFTGAAYITAVAISLPSFYTFNEFPRSPYRDAMDNLRVMSSPSDLIVHDNKLSYFPSYFHAPDLAQSFLADEPGSHNDTFALGSQEAMNIHPEKDIQAAVEGWERIFFVVFRGALTEYQQQNQTHPPLTWLTQNYRFVERHIYQDLFIYRFEK